MHPARDRHRPRGPLIAHVARPPAWHESALRRGWEDFALVSADRIDQPTVTPARRSATVAALSLVVAVVLGDSGVVTLALPEILRDFGAQVGEVAWVLIAFNLVLALVAVPAARVCVRGDPATASTVGVIGFVVATTACAVAPSLGVLIAARAIQAAGGAVVIVGGLELLVRATGAERAGARRWAAAGVAGAALGPVIGGLLTSAFSWRSIFVAQIPVVLVALPVAITLRERVVRHRDSPDTSPDRPHVLANLALALLSAALTAALFLLVLLLVDGWRNSPAAAAVAVTAVPVAALAAGPLFRSVRAGTRSEALAGSVLIAGGLTGLALLPHAEIAWTLAPQVLVGLGLGLAVDSLTAAALGDRVPRALHGGWTIAARHAGVVLGLAILTPIFIADLRHAETPAKEAVASLVLDAPLPASTKLDLAERLGGRLVAERGRVPDLRPAFRTLRLPASQAAPAQALELALEDQLDRAATRAFRTAFLVAAVLALLALGPALALSDRSRS
jgi:predicted MFS family arabinose efflux permease